LTLRVICSADWPPISQRLSSVVLSCANLGQRVAVVRAEGINITGSLFRNKVKFSEFLRKRLLTNPRRAFVHYRAPSRIFWRTVRGMLPHKISRGAEALGRLKVFEGVPAPYDTKKREVVPDALRAVKLSSFRKFCTLGDLSSEVGWGKRALVEKLENKRRDRASAWHKKRLASQNNVRKTLNLKEINTVRAELASYGY
jgi:large subunit ribosomal protein L13Ae